MPFPAKVDGEPCTAYMGSGASGHYVKMVHNGIEYAIMQMISEVYHLLKLHGGLNNEALHKVFSDWDKGRLQSYLIEITAAIFLQKDELSNDMLVDKISDTAHQKGTGAWMSQDAMATGSPIPVIDSAVSERSLSSMKEERVAASKVLRAAVENNTAEVDVSELITLLEDALYAGYLITYAQGLDMLKTSADFYKYGTEMRRVARIWRGGCIIRAKILEEIMEAYSGEVAFNNMLLGKFSEAINSSEKSLRQVVIKANMLGIPVPSFCSCLNYFDAYRSDWLPANLIQAQRDFFGAHTYERNDREGVFHTEWNAKIQ